MSVKVTSKGTELPLLNLKGKPYLQVAYRLVWFREDHPMGRISTTLVDLGKDYAVARAEIYTLGQKPDGTPFENLVSTAHKKEMVGNFGDFIEKAETGAIGRALAMAGYGTQFEPELDEGERLADSPVQPAAKPVAPKAAHVQPAVPAGPDREKTLTKIEKTAELLVKLGKVQAEDLVKMVEAYAVKKKEELNLDQLVKLAKQLEEKLK